ncbi:FMN-binding protein [Pseudemcibacter aquimaris]|uniref:FMN-binding protein n=1 Tax=Pseudemcibacter aquimaris TaxID=2857064 RepID=UPI002010D776|nr:FMN-binding protein [Pseudemcibacter aquimaris]MCC3860384.1 FMN-binding protein [Pseudemcibacter aquimaris]WDU57710.1 FMN-binding protein [Pseudemcibacter aquimaris]
MKKLGIIAAIFVVLGTVNASAQGTFKPAERVYTKTSDYVKSFFNGETPKKATVWVIGDLRDNITEVLNGADSTPVRYRYWRDGGRTLWVLESVARTMPITAGVVVENGEILDISVLVYRENRGYEVQARNHRVQYVGAVLKDSNTLSNPINGISGSTLSVNSMKRMARIALLLHNDVTSDS